MYWKLWLDQSIHWHCDMLNHSFDRNPRLRPSSCRSRPRDWHSHTDQPYRHSPYSPNSSVQWRDNRTESFPTSLHCQESNPPPLGEIEFLRPIDTTAWILQGGCRTPCDCPHLGSGTWGKEMFWKIMAGDMEICGNRQSWSPSQFLVSPMATRVTRAKSPDTFSSIRIFFVVAIDQWK